MGLLLSITSYLCQKKAHQLRHVLSSSYSCRLPSDAEDISPAASWPTHSFLDHCWGQSSLPPFCYWDRDLSHHRHWAEAERSPAVLALGQPDLSRNSLLNTSDMAGMFEDVRWIDHHRPGLLVESWNAGMCLHLLTVLLEVKDKSRLDWPSQEEN